MPDAPSAHARLPAILAELETGWEIWLEFACEAGAIGEEERTGLASRGRQALAELVALQASFQPAGAASRNVRPSPERLTNESTGTADRTKKAQVIAMLDTASGASVAEMMAATGWQKHSVRGFLSGTVVRRMGLIISSFKRDGGRVYRIDR